MPNYRTQFFKDRLQTERDGDSTQWKQAFDWGNHATSGYITGLIEDTTPYLAGELNLDNNDIVIDCRNDTGAVISGGTPVYVSGFYSNGKALIAPADASDSNKMPAFGMTNITINDGEEGTFGIMGVVTNFDTTAFNVGDVVYVASGGGITNIKPTGNSSLLIQNLGRVLRSHTNGRVLLLGSGRTNDVPNSGNFQTLTINNVYVFPTGDGSTGQFLKTDGSGNLSFSQSIISDTTNMGGATGINNIVSISQSGYNNLPVSSGGPGYNANTVYFIT